MKPPDSGKSSSSGVWKWMIVLAHGMCQSVILALVQNFALLFGDHFLRLDLTTAEVGVLLNCNAAVGSLFALAGGWTLGRLGYCRTAALGGVLLAAGVACSSQSASFAQLLFWYGVLSSLGAGLVLCATGAAVNVMSGGGEARQRALVAAAVGAGAAPVAAPLLVSGLLEWYGLPGAALVCAAVCLHCVVAALLLRPAAPPSLVGKLLSKEDGVNKQTAPRRGTIVPVMKIDAPEDEVKSAGSRRSSAMSSGPQRRGTPGWWARQSMGSIYAGTSSRIYDSRSYQLVASDVGSRRSSRSSSIGLEPPGGHDSTDAHSKSLGVPDSDHRAGDRRGSGLSVGSRWSHRLSVGSVHSTGSALVVVNEDEEQDLPHTKDSKERRPTVTSVVSSSLEVPGEKAPGSRRSSTASSGRGRQGGWWGRLSVGSVYSAGGSRLFGSRTLAVAFAGDDYSASGASSQSELSQRDGSTGSRLQIPSAARLEARRKSDDSRIGRKARSGSSGKLDMTKPNERTRQMSVSSVRSAASSTAGYMTAAHSLRSSGSQGSGLWWSTLSLASTHSAEPAPAIRETDEQPNPPAETSRLLGGDVEDMATPETPPTRRRGSWATTLGGPISATWGVSYNTGASRSPGDHPNKDSSTPEEALHLDDSNIHPVELTTQFPSDTSSKSSITPVSLLDTEDANDSRPSDSKARPPPENSTTTEYIGDLVDIGKDEKLSSVDESSTSPKNTLTVNMFAAPEDTSDLGSSDGEDIEDSSKEPEMPTKESIYGAGGEDYRQPYTVVAPINSFVTPSTFRVASEKSEEIRSDLIIEKTEVSDNVKNDATCYSGANTLIMDITCDEVSSNNDKENNILIPNSSVIEVVLIAKEKSGTENDRRDVLLDEKQESMSASIRYASTDKTTTARDELSYSADYRNLSDVKTGGETTDTDNHKFLGNNVETNISVGEDEKTSLLGENKGTEMNRPVRGKPTANNSAKPPERYSIIVSLDDGAADGAGQRGGTYSVDWRPVRGCGHACLLLGLALAHCADVNHVFFTPLLLATCGNVPLAMCALAAADLGARLLLTVALDGFSVSRKMVCLSGVALLVVSRSVLGMFTELSSVLLACVFVGASRGIKEVYFPAVLPADDVWSTLCIRSVSQGVVFLALGPLVGYMKDWSGNFGYSIIAINIATVVGLLLCCVENLCLGK